VKRSTPFLLALLFPAASWAYGLEPGAVTYNRDLPSRPIGNYLKLLDDPTGERTIFDVANSADFKPSTAIVPNLGISSSAHWAKFSIVNASPDDKLVLMVDYPEIEQLDIYLEGAHGIQHLLSGGQGRKLDRSTQESPTITCPLDIPYGGFGTVYIRVRSDKQLQLPLFVVSKEESSTTALNRGFFIGGYTGIMLVMILYNLFIYISIRDRNYFLYVLFILCVTITQLSFVGYSGYYIFYNNVWVKEHSSLILTVITAIVANIFIDHFIQAKQNIKYFSAVMNSFYALMITGAVLDIIGFRIQAYAMVQALSMVLAFYALAIAIIATRRKVRSARYFLVAWCVFLAGIVVFVAKDWGFVPYNDLTKYMMTIGSAVEVVLLAFGLADKINVLQHERNRSQAEALFMAKENELIIRDQNIILEKKVSERTHALQESNDHLKRTQSQLVNAEKMASLGQLTAGIAHEINNPINFISSNIPPLKRDLVDLKEVLEAYQDAARNNPGFEHVRELERRIDMPVTVSEVQEIMDCIEQGANRTSEIVRGLRTFSRLDEDDLKQADVNEGLRSTTVVLAPQFRDAVKINFNLGAVPEVECYPGKLNQAFMNLLNNAAHAVKKRHGLSGGEVSIGTELCGDEIKITIADNGIGMDEKVQERLFEPFFTTKEVGEGTGLGLSITQGIIEKHHGRLELESAVGVGSTFIITLPVTQAAALEKRA
jgi:signal transduction histidine kinase